MRKRYAARPMLESMEDRLVLSASGAVDPTLHLHAAVVAQHAQASTAQADHHATVEAARSAARAAHRHLARATHSAPKKSSSSSSLSNTFSNFFKSIGL
jgi:hypothetical protein